MKRLIIIAIAAAVCAFSLSACGEKKEEVETTAPSTAVQTTAPKTEAPTTEAPTAAPATQAPTEASTAAPATQAQETTEEKLGDFTVKQAGKAALAYVNNEDGLTVIFVDTINIDQAKSFYKFDLRRYNGTASSHQDYLYVSVYDNGKTVLDSGKFSELYGVE